ncbi:glutathione peroxidase [Brevibacillus humidisoli]|uniref:glutathione peroxidase n=1 Tax=Brevibacillus humidisoli TaxID=2895522 RepID=UPI001E487BB2|nr:glutathione peroxidase [Brevibacillus humidisoli]UFJ43367.1 glutathione peroxidase [Brevibacillus humidisoli]
MSVYDFSAKTLQGEVKSIADYQDKVLLIVNTASNCGFTPQYQGLQRLYETYMDQGFVVLAFPCNQFGGQEPGTAAEIESFCSRNYGVTFPVFDKVDVKGANAHPLFRHLTSEAPGLLTKQIKWNFTKFFIDREGTVVKRYAPATDPAQIEEDIQRLLQSGTI